MFYNAQSRTTFGSMPGDLFVLYILIPTKSFLALPLSPPPNSPPFIQHTTAAQPANPHRTDYIPSKPYCVFCVGHFQGKISKEAREKISFDSTSCSGSNSIWNPFLARRSRGTQTIDELKRKSLWPSCVGRHFLVLH
jgi:hypothetical protein